MKKLLSILASMGMVVTTSATVISCGNDTTSTDTPVDETPDLSKLTSEELKISPASNSEQDAKIAVLTTISQKYIKSSITESDLMFSGFVAAKSTSEQGSLVVETKDSTKILGKATFKIEFFDNSRTNFDLALVEQVVNDTSLGSVVRPSSLNPGFLMVEDIKSKESVFKSLNKFVTETLIKAKGFGYEIDPEIIMSMIHINYLDSSDKLITNNNSTIEIKSIVGTIKSGHNNDIDGYYANGSVKISIKGQTKLDDNIKTELGDILLSDPSNDYATKNELIENLLSTNSIEKNKKDNFNLDSYDLKEGKGVISIVINSDFAPSTINITFNITNKNDEKVGMFNLDSWVNEEMGIPPIKYQGDSVDATEITEYLFDTENNIGFWTDFSSNSGKYFFVGQKPEDENSYKDGTVTKDQFIADFANIINVTQTGEDITIEFKPEAKNKYAGYQLTGKATITNGEEW
ncbi:hypothetical protein SCORR_v1c03220 [Spiroplasma corruscae]|uniref:Lipoprotein-associated type-17 domain-containing protein n=1 Tax=Spiroplasma corruscae TaxID=216934 RepID=A0A222ENL3_9MOLU|nr:lipoprotein [Spiroplasma corruscae]ASP28096.1 hypothetical protein SCORR_v1c03220 [Spiroplasma corruscae]